LTKLFGFACNESFAVYVLGLDMVIIV